MNPRSKKFNFLALIVMISMIATTVSAQPNPVPAQKALSDVCARTSVSPPAPPEPEQTLTAPYVSEPVAPADTRGLPLASVSGKNTLDRGDRLLRPVPHKRYSSKFGHLNRTSQGYDPVVQLSPGRVNMPLPGTNWEGIASMGPIPPDTDGQVGPNHYVQIVNSPDGAQTRVWDKTGTELYDFDLGSLWPITDVCNYNALGDPIVVYDQMVDRWLLTQFVDDPAPYHECIAVSKGSDPTDDPNDWWLYTFEVHDTKFNDYPKFGVWPDGYYMSVNQFAPGWAGAGVFVFDRDAMINGDPATFQYFDLWDMDPNYGSLLPSNMMGDTLPPTGAPNYFMSVDMDWDGSNDIMHIFEFHTDWTTPLSSTFSLVADIVVAPFDWNICASGYCIDQPDNATSLDSLSDRLMMHLWYRNFGDYESWVVNHTVDTGTGRAGIRWYEFRGGAVDITLADATLYQQGTYAPDDTLHRWMGSIAMDGVGNIALGYSVANATAYPGIRYGGRQADDPLGTLPEAEVEIIAGSGVQTHPAARWGDYSAMSVDPVDDCTFWFTQEYVETTGERSWQTRVASFQYPSCSPEPKGILTGIVSDSVTLIPIAGVTIQATASPTRGYQTVTGADGTYTMLLLADTYTLTTSIYGYQPATVGPVDILSDTTSTQDITLTPSTMYTVEGTVTDDLTGWPLYAHITVGGDPLNPSMPYNDFWTDPATGSYSIPLADGITYTFGVEAWLPGYSTAGRDVAPLTADSTENFTLTANLATCIAPGYQLNLQTGVFERFNTGTTPAGWTVVDNASNGEVWSFDNPGGRDNLTGGDGGFAIVDSDNYGDTGHQDTELRTPSMDFSGIPSVTLAFDTDHWSYTGAEVANVDVSANGGVTWTNVFTNTGGSYRGPAHEVIDISALASGESDVLVRFYYYDAYYEWWWQVDNVLVGVATCDPLSGGFVVGNVYDDNTGDGLAGAEVANDSGYMTIAEATPQDPAVDDGFYSLFSPVGSHTFTATMALYTADVKTPTVLLSDTVQQDFTLLAGTLSYTPPALEIVLPCDMLTATLPLTLTNDGTMTTTFDFLAPRILLSEGFEGGVIPPDGWSVIDASTSTSHWQIIDSTTHSGDYAGLVDYEAADQDEWLISPVIDLSGLQNQTAEFWVYANNNWVTSAELQLLVIDSGGAFTDTLWQQSNETWPYPSEYHHVQVDLSAYTATPVRLAWRYVGNDGDSIVLDDILVTGIPAFPWLSMTPTSGTIPASSDQAINVTFDASGVVPGQHTTMLAITHDTPYDVPAIPVTLTLELEPTWDKTVYVNGEVVDAFPTIVVPSDTVTIVDEMWVPCSTAITFTLTEEWTESLDYVEHTVHALPGGTLIVPDHGTVIFPTSGSLVLQVTDAPGDWGYVITKTFTVLDVGGETDILTETLWVEGAYPQPDPVVLEFMSLRKIYLPLVMRD